MGSDTEVLERLHPGLQRLVIEKGWKGLQPIQRGAIPIILDGHDCVIEAPTAGGKTEAVLFPTLTAVAGMKEPQSVRILYLAPLRALLNDLETRGLHYAGACGLHAFKWHGDVSQKSKIDQLLSPPHLLLTTPESTEAILLRKAGWQKFFETLRFVIIDEAHNFALGDRGHHLLSLLQRLEHGTGTKPQRVALTATVGNPKKMLDWMAGKERSPGLRVRVGGAPPARDYKIHLFNEDADSNDIEPCDLARSRRFRYLASLLPRKKSIVFAGSRKKAEQLAAEFVREGKLDSNTAKVLTHHSAVSRFYREEAEARIRYRYDQGIDAIISTSTLELGIDIGELDQVVQLDSLGSSSALTQRVGRTGRRPGRPQVLRGLCVRSDDLVLLTAAVNLTVKGMVESLKFPRRAFHILAHQILCLSLQQNGVTLERIWETLRGAWCYSLIDPIELEALVEHMVEEDYLRSDGPLFLVGAKTERRFLQAGWRRLFAVFESAPLYEVHSRKIHVGTLDAAFVEPQQLPFNFALGGRLWQALSADPKTRIVRAVPARNATAPAWFSFGGLDVPFETAQEVGRLLVGCEDLDFLDEEAAAMLRDMRWTNSNLGWQPGGFMVAASPSEVKVITFAGDKLNRTLAMLFRAAGNVKASSSYREVTVRSRADAIDRDRAGVEKTLDGLRTGRCRNIREFERTIQSVIGRFPFSPFAACLPDPLLVAALADGSLAFDELQRYIGGPAVGL
jgi:ATP-dependent Lhr-like helicase